MSKINFKNGLTSNKIRVFIPDTTSVIGGGKTGLTFSSSGLIISTIADNEATPTNYTQAGSTIETITTLGTFAAPTATKCRFKEVDATNLPGIYEIQIADARFAVSGARSLIVSLPPVSGLGTGAVRAEIQLEAVDNQDATAFGVSRIDAAISSRSTYAGGDTSGTTTLLSRIASAITITSGKVDVNDKTGFSLSSGGVQAIWDALTSALTTSNSIGKLLVDKIDTVLSTIYSRIGAPAGASVSADIASIKTDTTTLTGRITAARAGYWDNLNIGGNVASQADIDALNQSASRRIIITSVEQYERPESGNSTYTIEARTYDGDGAAVNADTTPTLTATGIVSGSLAANLSAASNPATGVYRWTYTVSSSATIEQVRFDVSATLSSATFTLSMYSQITDLVAATFTTADRSALTAIQAQTDQLAFTSGKVNSQVKAIDNNAITAAAIATDAIDADAIKSDAVTEFQNGLATASALTNAQSDLDDIQTRLPAALVGGRMASDAVAISGSTSAADNVEANIGNLDAAVSTRATPAQVNTEADTALSDYGALKPTVAGRTLDVSAGGEAGMDLANVGSPASTVNLSGVTIKAVTDRVTANADQIEGVDATNQIRDSILTDATRFAGASLAAIEAKTNNLPAAPASEGNVTAVGTAVDDLNNLSAADVSAQLVDVLFTMANAEPGQGKPAADAPIGVKVAYIFKAWRNLHTQSSGFYKLFGDDGVTVDQKATTGDSSGIFTRQEIESGP